MDNKEKNTNEEIVVSTGDVKAEIPFDPFAVDFDKLDKSGKKEAFEKTLEQFKMLITVVKSFEEHMTELEKKAEGKVSEDAYKRLMADYDNYKRRNASARSEGFRDGQTEVFSSIIEVVDNFERALPMISDQSVKTGVELIYKQFMSCLEKFKVTEIKALGEPFDPNLMNAIMQGEATGDYPEGTVMEVFQKGYILNDNKGNVIRYAFVKVAK